MAEAQGKDTSKKLAGFSGIGGKSKSAGRKVLGKTEELGELVYKIGTSDQADLFIRTTEAIADYVGKEYGWELRNLVKYRKEAEFTKPKYPEKAATVQTRAQAEASQAAETVDNAQLIEYKAELEIYYRKEQKYQDDKAKVFVTILGQCTVGVKGWLDNGNGMAELEVNRDVVGLLRKLEQMAFSTGRDQDEFLTLNLSLRRLVAIQQGPKEHTAKYYKRFTVAADVLTGHWGEFYPPKLVKDELTKELAQDRFLARILLMGADKGRFGTLLDELNNNYIAGNNRYPKTLEETIRLLTKYQGPQKNPGKNSEDSDETKANSFAQQGKQKNSPSNNGGNRGRSRGSPTRDSDGSGDDQRGNTNRRSRSPSRGREEGWNT
jgi:hypothetical protein